MFEAKIFQSPKHNTNANRLKKEREEIKDKLLNAFDKG